MGNSRGKRIDIGREEEPRRGKIRWRIRRLFLYICQYYVYTLKCS